jgi:hypothetical protein
MPDGTTAPATTNDELNKMSPASGTADPATTAPTDTPKSKSKKRHSNKPK